MTASSIPSRRQGGRLSHRPSRRPSLRCPSLRAVAPPGLGEIKIARNRAAARLLPKARRIAHLVARRFRSAADREDIYGAACLGLAQALSKLDGRDHSDFDAYAIRRIRGAVMDHLRAADVLTRLQRASLRRASETARRLHVELERDAMHEEIARDADLSRSELSALLVAEAAAQPAHLDEEGQHSIGIEHDDPEALLESRSELDRLSLARGRLATRLQRVLDLYYSAEIDQGQIGKHLGISEARVSQLRNQALAELRLRMVSASRDS